MSEFQSNKSVYVDEQAGLRAYVANVYTRMGLGLLLTAIVAYAVHALGLIERLAMQSPGMLGLVYLGVVIVQFVIVFNLSARILKLSTAQAQVMFYLYAAITGLTFSVLLDAYDYGTVGISFAFTAALFFSCAVIGHYTQIDLTRFSTLLFGGLIALVIASVLGIFIPAVRDSLLLTYIGIVLFLGLTAYDAQRLKNIYYTTNGGYGQAGANLGIYGAFSLYLDFINMFLYILRLFGNRNRR